MKLSSVAQTGPSKRGGHWEEKLYTSLFILFVIVKIINSVDRKVVAPLLYRLYRSTPGSSQKISIHYNGNTKQVMKGLGS